jgi:RNA polymerase sigma-70 factor, ECF subfamily
VFPLSRRRRAHEAPLLDRQLAQLIDDHTAAVYHLAYGILRDPGLAEDAVQETMIKAWRSLGSFRGDSSSRTWILRIAHNTAIDLLRRRRERSVEPSDLVLEDGSTVDEPGRRLAARAELELLRQALAGLDELSRSIVVLREIEYLSYQEISETLDIPVTTVKTRLLRARRALGAAVEDKEDPDGTA